VQQATAESQKNRDDAVARAVLVIEWAKCADDTINTSAQQALVGPD